MESLWAALITALASTGVVGLFARSAQRGRSAQIESAITRIDRVLKVLPEDAVGERRAAAYARRLEVAALLSVSAVPGGLVWRPVLYFFLYVLGSSAVLVVALRLLLGRSAFAERTDPSFAPLALILLGVGFVLEVACGIVLVTQTVARRREMVVDDFMLRDDVAWARTRSIRYSPSLRARMGRENRHAIKEEAKASRPRPRFPWNQTSLEE